MGKVRTHKDLNVWKEAMELAKDIYSLTTDSPKEEIYGLVSQMRRAAVSIKDFIRFLYIALGSLAELETQLLLSGELGFMNNNEVSGRIDEIRRMLLGLTKSLRNRNI